MRIAVLAQRYFSKNYGVYALTYTAIKNIHEICSRNEISVNLEIYCTDTNFWDIKEELTQGFNFHTVRVLPILSPREISTYIKYKKDIAKCDLVFDTSLGDGFSDIYSKRKFLLQYFLKRIPELNNVPVILLPQTIGPYYNKLFGKMALKVIEKSKLTYTRDQLSLDYTKKLGSNANNIICVTDMAMRLPYDPKEYESLFRIKKFRIGLNVSGLLYNGGYKQNNQFKLCINYKQFIKRLVKELQLKYDAEIHLIPHVFSEGIENDYSASVNIAEDLGLQKPKKFSSPMEAKSYICHMNLFLGSRMHSTIGAISSGTPTIPIGYSVKFKGLFDEIKYPHYVDATDISKSESSIINEICNKIENIYLLENSIQISKQMINIQYEKFICSLEKIIREINNEL